MRRLWLAAIVAAFGAPAALGGDWPGFRGPRGDGISDEVDVPQVWGPETNIRWKAPMPGPGNSSPIVWGNHVYVTCATEEGAQRGLYCHDRNDGSLIWSAIVPFTGEEPTHGTNPPCAASPAADLGHVVVWHGSAGAWCYDHEGKELWSRDLGSFRHIWGFAASPVIHGDRVFLNCGPGARTFVAALDLESGEILWQVDEPDGDDDELEGTGESTMWRGSWSTPIVAQVDGMTQVVVSLPHHVQAYDPVSGQIVWRCRGLGELVYTSALVGNGMCVAMGGYSGPAIGLRLGGRDDVTESNCLWRADQQIPQRIGSGVILGDHIFMANATGVAQCIELETGNVLWEERLTGSGVWSSVLAAEGRLYATDQDGTTWIFAPNPEKLEILGQNELGETTNATLAFSNSQAFLRTDNHLWCIQESD